MYWAMHAPCSAQFQQLSQSVGAVQSIVPPLEDDPSPVSSVVGPSDEPVPSVAFVSAVVPESSAVVPLESSPSSVAGIVIVEAVKVAFVSSPESSAAQPRTALAIATRSVRMPAV